MRHDVARILSSGHVKYFARGYSFDSDVEPMIHRVGKVDSSIGFEESSILTLPHVQAVLPMESVVKKG